MENFDFIDDFIYERRPYKSGWKIRVKILRLWNTDTMFGEALEMVVCDEKRVRAFVSVLPRDVPKFRSLLKEGEWRVFWGFNLKQDMTYGSRPTSAPMKIEFMSYTIVTPVAPVMDSLFLNIERFFDIISRAMDPLYLIDVLGVVHRVGDLGSWTSDNGFVQYNLRFELLNDERNIIMPCTVRGSLAKQFYDRVKSIENELILCALRFWKVDDGTGVDKNSVVLTSVTISDFVLNPDDEDAREFLQRYLGN